LIEWGGTVKGLTSWVSHWGFRHNLGVLLLAILIVVVIVSLPRSQSSEPRVPEDWRFTLPAGNPAAGEEVFARMQCYSCHAVPGRHFVNPSENPGNIGPEFTAAYAALPREYLAESIVSFERLLAHGNFQLGYTALDGTSRMGDYSRIMTVRELIDVVEYLKQLH